MSKEDFKKRVLGAKAISDITNVAASLGLIGWGSRLFCPHCQKAGPKHHKTPDLQLYKDSFYCFKCSEASGDVLSLVQFTLSCSFMEALDWLEQRVNKNSLNKKDRLRTRETGFSYERAKNIDHNPRDFFQPLEPKFQSLVRAFPGSPGEAYLTHRGFSLKDIDGLEIGYSAPGTWPGRPYCKLHRIVFPHTDPAGTIINLYGRAIELPGREAPKNLRHTHLPCRKGYWNAAALTSSQIVWIVEGVFDALALKAFGVESTVCIYGLASLTWDWFKQVRSIVLCLDNDEAGRKRGQEIAFDGVSQGKHVFRLPSEMYRGRKDLADSFRENGVFYSKDSSRGVHSF